MCLCVGVYIYLYISICIDIYKIYEKICSASECKIKPAGLAVV